MQTAIHKVAWWLQEKRAKGGMHGLAISARAALQPRCRQTAACCCNQLPYVVGVGPPTVAKTGHWHL